MAVQPARTARSRCGVPLMSRAQSRREGRPNHNGFLTPLATSPLASATGTCRLELYVGASVIWTCNSSFMVIYLFRPLDLSLEIARRTVTHTERTPEGSRDASEDNAMTTRANPTPEQPTPPATPSRPRGFALLDPERRREIASQGGTAAQADGRAHQFTPEEARAAGRKGGEAIAEREGHMSRIGRKGGLARAARAVELQKQRAADRGAAAGAVGQ